MEYSMSREISVRRAVLKAIVSGGTATAALDAVDAVIAFKAILGLDPVAVYQFVASGMLGQRAFDGGFAGLPISYFARRHLASVPALL